MKGKLNQKTAAAWDGAPGRMAYLWDQNLRGFGLRVNPNGSRFFIVRYSLGNGETEMMTLGRVAELTLDDAREQAREALQEARAGGNPRTAREMARAEPNFEDLVARFRTDVLALREKQTDFHEKNLRRLEAEFKGIKVKDLSLERIDRFRAQYGALAPINFNRNLATLSTVLNHAEIWGMRAIGSNPCQRIRRFKELGRDRILTEEEITRLGDQIRIFRISGGINRQIADLVEIVILTGARVSEILNARWHQVDFRNRTLNLLDSKTGKGKIRLPERAIGVLEDMAGTDRDLHHFPLFPGRNPLEPMAGYHKVWDEMRKAAGIEDVWLKDLRHVLASYATSLGASRRTIADLLRHKKPEMTDRYIQGFTKDQEAASEKTSQVIGEALTGLGPGRPADSAKGVEDI